MSTTPITPAPAPSSHNALLQEILGIISIGATAATGFTGAAGVVAIEQAVAALANIGRKAAAAYQAQVGQPLDLTLIPEEDLIPDPSTATAEARPRQQPPFPGPTAVGPEPAKK